MQQNSTDRLEPGTVEGDAGLLAAVRAGDETAFGRLYDAWFDRSYDVALRIVREGDAAADVAQDAFLAAWRNLDDLDDQQAFGGWLLRITRNRALDHKRKHDRSRPVDDETMAMIEATATGARSVGADPEGRLTAAVDPARAMEDAQLAELVWEAAEALGDRDASLLDLHLRHDLSPAEIAEDLGVKANAAHQSLHRMRDRLAAAVAARVLWKGGTPTCSGLADVLEAAGGPGFDEDTAARVRRHAKQCDECRARQRTHLEPSSLFAALPVAIAPVLLKAKAAAAMEAAGVPMSGSNARATEGTNGPGRSSGRRLLTAGVTAAVVLMVVVATVLALSTRSIDDESRAGSASTTVDSSGGVSSATTEPSDSTTGPGGVVPVPDGPAPDTGSTPPGGPAPAGGPSIVSFSLSPISVPPESSPPTIAWSVDPAGSGSAELTGPNLLITALSGAQPVCPGVVTSGVCVTAPGAYDYTLHAYDGSGDQVEVRTITLVVG